MTRSMSERGIADLVADEGEVLTAYRCPAGVLTIGVGLTAGSGVVKPKPGMTITQSESRRLLREALSRNYEPRVRSRLPGINQHEFDGSTSFDFNTGRIHNATWPGLYLSGQFVAAETSFKSWNKAGGRVLAGLSNRRRREWDTIRHGKYHSSGQPVTAAPALTPPADIWDRLKALGHKETTAVDAVRAFQAKHGLKVDGLVGPATRSALIRAEEAKRTGQATAGGGVAGGAAGGGADGVNDPAVTIETLGAVGATGLVVAGVIFAGFLIWRFRGPLFARLPEPAKDFAQDRLGITIGRRVAVPA
jgi:lysozyme